MPIHSRRIAVIGAGAGGLSTARFLLADGHDVTVFEGGSFVGGLWVYGNDNGLSVAYASLHINSEPRASHLRGFPFPEGSSLFPSHVDMHAYFMAFADHFGITERIRFNTPVACVEPIGGQKDNGWLLRLLDGSEEQFDDVVIATGHQGIPLEPAGLEDFTGEYLHSKQYRDPEPFAGRKVLVIGIGNSGLDIAADLAINAEHVYVSARSPVLIMPRMMWGAPSGRTSAKIAKPYIPWWIQRRIFIALCRVFHGRMEDWGLQTPKTRTHPASSPTFMAHVAYRRITCLPGIQNITGQQVTFTNGVTVEVDTIIAATGYDVNIPILPPEVSPVVGKRIEVFNRVVHPSWPGLFFVGFFNVSGGANISMMDDQAEWLTDIISGRCGIPSEAEMRREMEAGKEELARRFPGSARYELELEPRRYRKKLKKLRAIRATTSAPRKVGSSHE
jgi:dimethylaniline monooxygenase (N-oxide forming)